jgi:hypothetical protein
MDQSNFVIINTKRKRFDLQPWKNDDEVCNYRQIGTVIDIDGKKYILTCYHGVKNGISFTVYSFIENKRKGTYEIIKHQIETPDDIVSIPDFDISLIPYFQAKGGIRWDIFCKDLKLPKEGTKCQLTLQNPVRKANGQITLDTKKFSTHIVKTEFFSLISFHRIKVPFVQIETRNIKDSYPDLHGISGSCIVDNKNRIVGLVSHIQQLEDVVAVVPVASVNRLISEFRDRGNSKGLCSIVGKANVTKSTDNNNNAVLVVNSYDINYNYNPETDTINSPTGFNIKDLDLILEVGHKKFNEKGELFDERLDSYVPLSTFIALNYMKDQLIPLTINRMSTNLEHRRFRIKLKSRPYRTTCYLNDVYDNRFFKVGGLIFVELSEDLVDFYEDLGLHLIGDIEKYRITTPYRNSNRKLIALVDLDKTKLSDEEFMFLENADLPMRKVFGHDFNIAILTNVGNKKIHRLEQMKDVDFRDCSIYLSLSKFIRVRINLVEGKIKQISTFGKKSRNKI